MGKPLDIAAAELSLKDKATKPLKKLDKGMKKSVKLLSKTEKQTKKNEKSNIKYAKSLDKIAKAEKKIKGKGGGGVGAGGGGRFARTRAMAGRGRAGAKKGGRFAAGALTAFGGGVASLPVVGGAIAAILGAITATRKNFLASVKLQVQTRAETANFKNAFRTQKTNLAAGRDKMFRTRDQRQALTGLADRGVGDKAIAKNQDILSKFTKAQGFTTLTEGISALTSGSIKAGRGISTIDIKQIQAIAPLLNDVSTAGAGFDRIAEILKGGKMDKSAKRFEKTMLNVLKTQNSVNKMLEATTKKGYSKTGFKAFVQSEKAIRAANKATAKIARVSGKTVGSLITGAGDFIEDPAAFAKKKAGAAWGAVKSWFDFKADGGPLTGKPTIVGERGPELLVPGTSGSIIPNHRINTAAAKASAGGKMSSAPVVNFNPTININVTGDANAQSIAQQVQEQLSKMVNSLRFETGMRLQG